MARGGCTTHTYMQGQRQIVGDLSSHGHHYPLRPLTLVHIQHSLKGQLLHIHTQTSAHTESSGREERKVVALGWYGFGLGAGSGSQRISKHHTAYLNSIIQRISKHHTAYLNSIIQRISIASYSVSQ